MQSGRCDDSSLWERQTTVFESIFFDIPAMYLLDGYTDLFTYIFKSVKFNDELPSEMVVWKNQGCFGAKRHHALKQNYSKKYL